MSALLPPAISTDGECSHVVNLRCRDGVWSPVGTPACCYTPADASHRLVFVHVNEAYKHYFTYDGTTLFYEAEETDGAIVPLESPSGFEISGLERIEAVGNAMVVFTETSMQYLFYVDGTYRFLGERPDFPEISFSMSGKTVRAETWNDYALISTSPDNGNFVLSDNDKVRFSSLVYGTYSRAKSALLDDGYLSFPFLVRYALRLYDDSYIYPSPPVLMCCSDALPFENNLASMCKVKDHEVTHLLHNPFSLSGEKVHYTVKKADLSPWSDIVKGIDIFFSRELPVVKDATIETYYLVQEPDGNGDMVPVMRFSIPVLSGAEEREQIVNESLFYKVASLDIKTLTENLGTARLLEYSCSLSNLVHQRYLPLDNFSLHTLRAKDSYVYNGRLHLGNVTTRFFDGYPLSLFSVEQTNYHGKIMPVLEHDPVVFGGNVGLAKRHEIINIVTCIEKQPADGRIRNLILYQSYGAQVKLYKFLHIFHLFIERHLQLPEYSGNHSGSYEIVTVEGPADRRFKPFCLWFSYIMQEGGPPEPKIVRFFRNIVHYLQSMCKIILMPLPVDHFHSLESGNLRQNFRHQLCLFQKSESYRRFWREQDLVQFIAYPLP